jgi:hypothetical protein
MECKLCGSSKIRGSRLRLPDLSHLIFLQYPVRCRVCYKREFVNIFKAFKVRRDYKARQKEERRRRKVQQASIARQA